MTQRQVEALIVEIEAYLSVIHAFREEGCEPRWRLEGAPIRSQLAGVTRAGKVPKRRSPHVS